MDNIDPRIVRVSVEVAGHTNIYEDLKIIATGTRFADANQNQCEVTIFNMDQATRDYILTETSPFNKNRKRKRVTIEAGRLSYGTAVIYIGDIISATITQPPDIGLKMNALTGNFKKGDILGRGRGSKDSLSNISGGVARDNEVGLRFEATDKTIGNYQHNGSALSQIDTLGDCGDVDAYLDNNVLVVKDKRIPLKGTIRKLSINTGMIGIPELTEHGIKVSFFIDSTTTVGSGIEVESVENKSVNGLYVIYKLGFNIANRDIPFYYVAEAIRMSNS